VLDLGWTIPEQQSWASGSIPDLQVMYAGNFLAANGGYPSDRSWAPAGSTVFVSDPDSDVAAQVTAGASAIKITLNAEAGPVHSDEVLAAVVNAAHNLGRIPVIHAEGTDQAERAIAQGAVVLAHTPFTQILSDDVIEFAARNNVAWMSTLDIHGYGDYGPDFEVATQNLRRFIAAGGRVFYGTDLGNGPLPVGVNSREVDALLSCGMTAQDVLTAMTTWWDVFAQEISSPHHATFISEQANDDTQSLGHWLAHGRIVEI
jgi:imidazolonepropionase-like amidohydrolase